VLRHELACGCPKPRALPLTWCFTLKVSRNDPPVVAKLIYQIFVNRRGARSADHVANIVRRFLSRNSARTPTSAMARARALCAT
jgi:hypothetical protein